MKGEGFAAWVKSETVYSLSNAYELINVAEKFKDQPLPKFGRSVLYLLAAPSTPETVVEKALEKAETGDKVSVADVQHWKEQAQINAELYEQEKRQREANLPNIPATQGQQG